ncbi:MAG: 50S ribosomal protein L25/general stress protein Ctc [Deltaproteobacteria bacterium]|jgi:large subunit ribosomal protein L25|nr:50S ribosomal protein L25/general stress protein Ctc [Deltaproteobacteria bacterium]
MSEFATLQAKKREQTGKGVARRLRVAGQVPAVFYNALGESQPIQINEKELTKLYQTIGRTSVFNIEIDNNGSKEVSPALIWDVDFFPIKNRIQHMDIYGVDLNKEISIRVPLVFTGVAKGTKIGGKLETYREIIEVASKPLSLPKKIELDISDMDINTSIRVADLKLPEGVRAEYTNNFVIVSVLAHGADDEEEKA